MDQAEGLCVCSLYFPKVHQISWLTSSTPGGMKNTKEGPSPGPARGRLPPLLIPQDFYFTSTVDSVGISMCICSTLRYICFCSRHLFDEMCFH